MEHRRKTIVKTNQLKSVQTVMRVDGSSNNLALLSAGSNGKKTTLTYHVEFEHVQTA